MKSLGPTMPLIVDDFLGGTQHMTAAQIGMYILLLMEQWRNGSVDVTPAYLVRVSRAKTMTQLKPVLAKFYKDADGNYRNAKMELIRAERMDYIASQSIKGNLSVAARMSTAAGTAAGTAAQPRGEPEDLSPSPSPILNHIGGANGGGFSLDQCLAAAQTLAMPREMVEAFFNHYDQYDWMGSQGRRITKLHSALAKWKANQTNFGHGPNGGGSARTAPPSPYARKKAAEDELLKLRTTNYPTAEQTAEITRLRAIISECNKAIIGGKG